MKSLAFKAEYLSEFFDRDLLTPFLATPLEMDTQSIPVSLSYFTSIGLFARITDTFVNQEITTARGAKVSDGFSLVDLAVGYSFPKRRGQISFLVKNVFDEDFNYQGLTGIRTTANKFEPLYYPETLFMFKCSLSF
jgi:outer membrane receptor protein involved in Fe transport